MATIHVNLKDTIRVFRDLHKKLDKKKFDRATVQAINHTIRKAKTASAQNIRKTYGARSKDIKKSFSIRRANSIDPSAAVIARGSGMPLMAFRPRQTKKGVTVRIKGKRKLIQKAFIAEMGSGHSGVFARGHYSKSKFKFRKKRVSKGAHDLPINELNTLSVPSALNNDVILNNIQTKMNEDFPVRLQHLLQRMK